MWKRVLHLVWALYFVYIVVEVTMNNWTWLNILVVGSQWAGGLRPSVKCVSYIYVWFNCKRKMVGNKISRNLCHWGARCLLGKCLLNFHFVFFEPFPNISTMRTSSTCFSISSFFSTLAGSTRSTLLYETLTINSKVMIEETLAAGILSTFCEVFRKNFLQDKRNV